MAKNNSRSWRVNDIVVASVVAVACGLIFWFWSSVIYPIVSAALVTVPQFAPLAGGGWLIAGILGAVIVRKPGAALYCELIAAIIEGILGTHFGWTVIISGLVQGLGAEIVFALVAYKIWNLGIAILAGAVSGLSMGISEVIMYYASEMTFANQIVYSICAAVSGAVIAGLLSWLLMKALAQTGVLSSLASGRTARNA